MPTAITSTRKNVAKPSTISMFENDEPRIGVGRDGGHQSSGEGHEGEHRKVPSSCSRASKPSISMIRVPATVMMISGRMRR